MGKGVKCIMMFEVMAISEEKVKEFIARYLEKLKAEKSFEMGKVNLSEPSRVEKPRPDVKEAYWQSAEVETSFKDFKSLLYFTMRYGPSSIEIMEPKTLEMKMSEAQDFTNELAKFMHMFAAKGAGGIVMTPK